MTILIHLHQETLNFLCCIAIPIEVLFLPLPYEHLVSFKHCVKVLALSDHSFEEFINLVQFDLNVSELLSLRDVCQQFVPFLRFILDKFWIFLRNSNANFDQFFFVLFLFVVCLLELIHLSCIYGKQLTNLSVTLLEVFFRLVDTCYQSVNIVTFDGITTECCIYLQVCRLVLQVDTECSKIRLHCFTFLPLFCWDFEYVFFFAFNWMWCQFISWPRTSKFCNLFESCVDVVLVALL